jgi:hypothetical protein
MTKSNIPPFKSLKEEREFWQTHDVFEVLGEEGWEVVEAGTTQVRSFYIARVGKRGAMVRIPKELLERIGAKDGGKVRAWTEGKRLVLEAV